VIAASATKDKSTTLQQGASESLKRARIHSPETDWFSDSHDSPYAVRDFTEAETIWHPIGC
jgi:hypothetical protein